MPSQLKSPFRVSSTESSLRQVFGLTESCTETLDTHQLVAELWIERFLNHLTTQLQEYLTSEANPPLWQVLVAELGHAFPEEIVAICLPDSDSSTRFQIQHCSSSMRQLTPSRCMACPTSEFGNILSASDLTSLSQLDWQSAWELADHDGGVGWLIVASGVVKAPMDVRLVHLRSQCIERTIAQTMRVFRQAQHLQRLQQNCEQLQAKNRDLTQTSQRKSEFLANTSHEIRTPLSSILGFTHLLREQGCNPSNLRHQEYLKIILSSGQHLLALINDILDLSKIEANQLTLQPETVEVSDVCKIALKLVQEKANDKGLTLKVAIAPEVTTLSADPLRLKQMLFNLLSNALKFTHQGSVGLEVQCIDQWIHFTVWDTGTGIAEDQQHLIFRPYHQLTNAIAGEGTGLGLALTQKLAGWIQFESKLNQGSRFTIALPLHTEVPAERLYQPASSSPASPLPDNNPTRSYHILLVEDNPHNARLLITYLCKLGYEVTWAKNGEELWRSLKHSIPALILMDIHLPGVDGLTLTKQLQARKRYKSIPVIIQTAMAMKGDREKCLESGAIDYVSKPIDLTNLAQIVAKYSQSEKS
jgi:signal transduction histidine kinase/ActR/RegA family two-component response regulator